MDKMQKFYHDPPLPPESSCSGCNTCYHYCPTVNRRSNYGTCLFSLKNYERGQMDDDHPCHQAIQQRQCPARDYRDEEQEAGEALYFRPRPGATAVSSNADRGRVERPRDPSSASYMRGWEMVDSEPSAPPSRSTPKPEPKPDTGTLAEAVTHAATAHAEGKSEPKPKPERPLSLLERAKAAIKAQGETDAD